MKGFSSIFMFILLLVSCSVDYNIDQSSIIEPDRLVVNSILTPMSPIEINFYTTYKTDTAYWFHPVKDISVTLKENETVLFKGICNDTVLQLDYYPKIGANYSIEVSLNGYETVSASTQIPDSITCTARMDFPNYSEQWVGDNITTLSRFKYPAGENSMWITAYLLFTTGELLQYNDLYANNMLVDKVNRLEGSMAINNIVGSGYHEVFLRVRNKNLQELDSIVYTPSRVYVWGLDSLGLGEQQGEMVKVITASKEYDQYNKSFYQQKSMIIYDDDISAIVYQPIQVYSNVKNGLGIFAGMSESNYYHYFDTPQKPRY